MNTIADALIFLGFIQGVVLFIFLFLRKVNRLANKSLAVLLLTASLSLGFDWLGGDNDILGIIHYFAAPYLPGPLLFLYVAFLTSTFTRFKKIYLLHFLPAVATAIILTGINYEWPFLHKGITLDTLDAVTIEIIFIVALSFLYLPQLLIYFITIFVYLRRYHKKLENEFSNTDKLRLRWLMILIPAFLIVYGMDVINSFFIDNRFMYPGLGICTFLIGYYGLWQPEIFNQVAPPSEKEKQQENLEQGATNRKYSRSSLDGDESKALYENLLKYVDVHAPYKDQNITLVALAEQVGMTTHDLSQIINTRHGRNFNHFINHFRVEEAKRMFNDRNYDTMNLLTVCYEAGFNSKSVFNKFFKLLTGITPTQYRLNSNPAVKEMNP